MLRQLRIVFSATCLIACVFLIMLRERSYVHSDQLSGPISKTKRLLVGSLAGAVQFRLDDRKWSNPNSFRPWGIVTDSVADLQKAVDAVNAMQATLGSQQA